MQIPSDVKPDRRNHRCEIWTSICDNECAIPILYRLLIVIALKGSIQEKCWFECDYKRQLGQLDSAALYSETQLLCSTRSCHWFPQFEEYGFNTGYHIQYWTVLLFNHMYYLHKASPVLFGIEPAFSVNAQELWVVNWLYAVHGFGVCGVAFSSPISGFQGWSVGCFTRWKGRICFQSIQWP